MRSPFVVCGATGNVGSRITEMLLAAGEPVRAVGRERVRLGPLAAKGAEPWPGDIGDSSFLEKVFSGARGAIILIPPRYDAPDFREYQNRIGASLVSALSKARVPRIVALSSVGAHLTEGTGPILGLHDFESRLSTLKEAEVVCLRPAYFMENHLWSIPLIRNQGINGSPIRADVPLPMIATVDIADATARMFVEGKFHGHADPLPPRAAGPDDDRGHPHPWGGDRDPRAEVRPVPRGGVYVEQAIHTDRKGGSNEMTGIDGNLVCVCCAKHGCRCNWRIQERYGSRSDTR